MERKGWAFLVGIDEYSDPNLPDFQSPSPTEDVQALKRVFNPSSNYSRYAPQVVLTRAQQSGQEITREMLERELSQFLSTEKYDNILLYFSGHGYRVLKEKTESGEIFEGYFATYDSKIKIEGRNISSQENGFSFSRLAELISQAKHLRKLVLLIDVCHSGMVVEEKSLLDALSHQENKPSYCILVSSLNTEKSYSGVFTQTLLQRLNDRDRDEAITGAVIAEYVDKNTNKKNPKQCSVELCSRAHSITLINYFEPLYIDEKLRDDTTEDLLCPYRGLRYFDDKLDQQIFFFGRGRDIEKLRNRLEDSAFIPVIGASGSGKSSLVRAGLLRKQLRQERAGNWQILPIIRPGDLPLGELRIAFSDLGKTIGELSELTRFTRSSRRLPTIEIFRVILEAMRETGQRYLLVIDQFEEVFTFTAKLEGELELQEQLEERDCFLNLITYVAQVQDSPLKVLVTLRADFLAPCLQHPALKDLIELNAVYVAPLLGAELQEAIEEPARVQGYSVDPELTAALIRDAANEPGYLPLLEFTLEQLWSRREDESKLCISLTAYEQLGDEDVESNGKTAPNGLKRALNWHADRVFEFSDFAQDQPRKHRNDQEREWIRLIFLRLVRMVQGETDTRQRQPRKNLLSYEQLGDEGVESNGKTAPSGLKRALNWHADRVFEFSDFVQDQPRKHRNDQEREWIRLIFLRLVRMVQGEMDTRQRQPRKNLLSLAESPEAQQRLDGVIGSLIEGRLLVADQALEEGGPREVVDLAHEALIEGWKRFDEWRTEDREIRRTAEKLAEARRDWERAVEAEKEQYLITRVLLEQVRRDWEQIRLYSLKPHADETFYRLSDQAEKAEKLELQLQVDANRVERMIEAQRPTPEILSLVVQTMGKNQDKLPEKLISSVPVCVRQTVANQLSSPSAYGHSASVTSMAFSPDGNIIVSGSDDQTVRLWTLDGIPIGQPFQGHSESVTSVAFSPDGNTIVSGSDDQTVRLWTLDGIPIGKPFQGHSESVISVAFSPDGNTIVSGSDDQMVRLWKLDGTPIGKPFQGHSESVTSVAISPDGNTIVSGSDDQTVRLWKLDGTPIGKPFQGHSNSVNSVAFSPRNIIVSGSDDNTVRLWTLDGTLIGKPFKGHSEPVNSVAFSLDGNTIVSGSDDNTVRLWTLDGTPIGLAFQGHSNSVNSVAFSPRNIIVSGSDDQTVRLWKLDGTPIGLAFQGHSNSVNSVAFSPDGKTIVSGSDDNTVWLWKLDGTPIGRPFQGHSSYVNSVAFSPDGNTIVSGSGDQTVRLWKLDGTPIGKPFQGHSGYVSSVAFSPDGKTIVSGSEDQTVRLWNFEDGVPIGLLKGHSDAVWSVAFSPDGKTIISRSRDYTVRLWSFEDGTPIGLLIDHAYLISSVAFSPDGKTIVSGSNDYTVRLWTLDGIPIGKPFQGHSGYVSSVAFSPDGKTIVSGSNDTTMRLWNLNGTPIGKPFQGHSNAVRSVAFSPDGNTIVSGSNDKTVRLWTLDGTPIRRPFQGHSSYITSVAFSPDGKTIVSGSDIRGVELWNFEDGTPIFGRPFEGGSNSVNSVAFSPDGKTIINGSDDYTVRLWNFEDRTPIGRPFQGHSALVASVAFSPDGKTIVSGGYDNTVRLWTLNGIPIGKPFQGHFDFVTSVAFSPNGKTIISGSWDGTLLLWSHINPTSWLRTCCQRLHNNWTHDPDLIACRTCLTEEAATQAEAGNFAAAIPLFEKAIATKTRFLITSEATGETIPFHTADADDPAKQAIHKEAKQKVAPYIIQQGEALAHSGNYNQALKHFNLAQEYDPHLDLDPIKKAKQLTVPILVMQAKIQNLAGDQDTAQQTHDQIKPLDPTAAAEIEAWFQTH